MSISINGQACFKMQIDDRDQRNFGFFHYADKTELRVRNVVWAGEWPKSIPMLSDQDLASTEADILAADATHLTESFEYNFAEEG